MDSLLWAAAGLAVGGLVSWWWVRRPRSGDRTPRAETERVSPVGSRESDTTQPESDGLQELILSSMQDGIVLFDARGTTIYTNDAIRSHLGSVPHELTGLMPIGVRNAAVRAARDRSASTALVETGTPSRWLRAIATPAGEEAVLLTIRDVTEALRADAIRRDFVANASHELKSPAAAIQAAAETIRQAADDDPAAVPRFASQLEQEAWRLSRIVADLLDLSRLESGSDLSERVHLDAIVREQVEAHEEAAREAGLTIKVESSGAGPVLGSARDLSLLVRNLLDNAIRYARRAGTVTIATDVSDRRVTLSVADDGIGIPTKDLPRVFERFYRVDRARSRETGGTGLGLAIVKHVAENHGGHVHVESELGQGSTFRVSLPRA